MAPGALSETATVEATGLKAEFIVVNGEIQRVGNDEVNGVTANGHSAPGAKAETEAESEIGDDGSGTQPMKCEIKLLDKRYDDDDEAYFSERVAEVERPKQQDWWRLFAFCLVRNYDSDGDLEGNTLYVNPQPLRQLLADVIGNYPGDPIDVDDVQIQAPYHSLFYYRHQIEAEGLRRFAAAADGEESDEESLKQLKVLLDWIKAHFADDIAACEKCTTQAHKVIAYDKLWTLFPPGTIAYSKVLSQNRAFRVRDSSYEGEDDDERLTIRADFFDFDGEHLGTRRMELAVSKYQGARELSELGTIPLDLLDDAVELREELVTRGRRFEAYVGQHFLRYDGIAIKKMPDGYARFAVDGRVMIDCKTFHRMEPNDSFVVTSADPSAKLKRSRKRATTQPAFVRALGGGSGDGAGNPSFDPLPEEDVMLTNATVRGFSFSLRRFLEFFVEDLAEIEWNSACFDELVLDPGVKKTVQALVATHARRREEALDDIVKGKGSGLVCVLHGPPGVGKTLTAECVAEFVKRPLYMVSSGDLGNHSGELDRNLTRIMSMTAAWRAVLLIDEADVFLERRSLHDLHRNAMVSVFLRVLEYHSGILFLTTNRVTAFDGAFKSRIHIPIRYTELTADSRRQIWRHFCGKVPGGVDVDEAGLATLAEQDLNGRQIKNAIKAAESLAAFDGVRLDLTQLLQITKILATFETDLASPAGVDYTAPGSSKDASRNMFL